MTALLLAYQAIGTLGFILALPWILIRALRRPAEMRERLGGGLSPLAGSGPLWIHAASLGELEAVRTLLDSPERRFRPPVHLSVLSVSARIRVEEMAQGRASVGFAPLDLWFCYGRVLRRVKPRGVVLLETELWPGFLHACRRREIPVVVISARLSRRNWGKTRLLRPILRPLLESIPVIGAQSEADAGRFRQLGAPRVLRTGNLKYRAVGSDTAPERLNRRGFVFVAGSLRRGEEEVLGAGLVHGLLMVVAPRHLRERDHWVDTCNRAGLRPVLRSGMHLPACRDSGADAVRARLRTELSTVLGPDAKGSAGSDSRPGVLLVDTHGELGNWYRAADAAFVGGTLIPVGGHNLFEPAGEGVPVAFGPWTANVEDVAEALLRSGGGIRVTGCADLCGWLRRLIGDPDELSRTGTAARETAVELGGSVERTWEVLESLGWPGVCRTAGGAT